MRRIGLLLALGILVGATALRFVALEAGLPLLLTRPDEETVLAATGELARHAPLSWATYPSAYLWTTWRAGAVGLLISGGPGAASYLETLAEHPDRLIAIGRRWSAFVGTATVLVLMVVSRRESGPV